MARTVIRVFPSSQQPDASLGRPTPIVHGPFTLIEGGSIIICQVDGDGSELIMLPGSYEDRDDFGEDAAWRRDRNANRCWKTTQIYQHIEAHPRLVGFIRPDAWTELPILKNPGGPNLREFLDANRLEMYDQRNTDSDGVSASTACARVKTARLNLVYQWAIHLAGALEFIHSHSFVEPAPHIFIVLGALQVESCWLSSSGTSLSVLGFLNAQYRTRSSPLFDGDLDCSMEFRPIVEDKRPTMQSDLFLYGCVVYELMTSHWPGEGQGLSEDEQSLLVSRREWPRLETVYLGDVVRKSWTGEIKSAADLLLAVRRAIADLGVVVGSNDEIVDLGLEGLTI